MNDLLLQKAEKWFAELSVKTVARPTCLMVNESDLSQFGTASEVLTELKTAVGSARLFWGERGTDREHLYLHSI